MDTIIYQNGIVNVKRTVIKTIKYLVNNKGGLYSIIDIQRAINNQLEPQEWLTQHMVRRALVIIFGEVLDKYGKP